MAAPSIPDALEASCKAPGVWLVQGVAIVRQGRGVWVMEDVPGYFRTLQGAIDHLARDR